MKLKTALGATLVFVAGGTQLYGQVSPGKQIAFLAGYTPVHVGSKIDHDARFAASLRLPATKIAWDFDLDYFTSSNTWSQPIPGEVVLATANQQETRGMTLGIGVTKLLKNVGLGVGLSASYFDINQSLNLSVFELETGQPVDDQEISPSTIETQFFAPGIFFQSDLGFPVRSRMEIYFQQKLNLHYIGDKFDSSFWNSWLSYSILGGLRLGF